MLLKGIALLRVIQVVSEVRVKIKQGPAYKPVGLEGSAASPALAVITGKRPEFHPTALAGINIPEPVQASAVYKVQRQLSGRIEIVTAIQNPESQLLIVTQLKGVIPVDVIPPVSTRVLKRPIGVSAFISQIRISLTHIRTHREERPPAVEVTALQPQCYLVGQRFPLLNMHHAQAAEVAILSTKRPVDQRHLLNQFRAQSFQSAKVTLPMPLRSLILLNVVHHHLQPAVHPAMIQVETKPPDFQRLAAALMLPRVDACVQLLQHLVVTREQSSIENLFVAHVNRRFVCVGRDHYALALRRQLNEAQIYNL